MEVILNFNLPDDDDSFRMCTRASTYYRVLWEISNMTREIRKGTLDLDSSFINDLDELLSEAHLDEIT
jgi:hypothetical protein